MLRVPLQLVDLLLLAEDHVSGEDLAAEQQTHQCRQASHLQSAAVRASERGRNTERTSLQSSRGGEEENVTDKFTKKRDVNFYKIFHGVKATWKISKNALRGIFFLVLTV